MSIPSTPVLTREAALGAIAILRHMHRIHTRGEGRRYDRAKSTDDFRRYLDRLEQRLRR